MTKEQIIDRYGSEYYERLKEKQRQRAKVLYDANPEAERKRRRDRFDPVYQRAYYRRHREVYRINIRDRNRLTILKGMNLSGKELHHIKYHTDNNDASWINDILILSPEEHERWHREHPDFKAEENII